MKTQEAELAETKAKLDKHKEAIENIKLMVNKQARDKGLWFIATTAPEGYLQRELRILHGLIEHYDNPD